MIIRTLLILTLSIITISNVANAANQFKEYECKMSGHFDSFGLITEKTYYLIGNENVKAFGCLMDQKKDCEYLKTQNKGGKYKWKEVWGTFNQSTSFVKLTKTLVISNNNKDINLVVRAITNGGDQILKVSNGKCESTGYTE